MYPFRRPSAAGLKPNGLTEAQQEQLVQKLGAHYSQSPGFWSQMAENLSSKLSAAAHQPVEYSVFFALTSVVPFIDETTAGAITDKFSRRFLNSSGFKAPHPESPEYKSLLRLAAVSRNQALKQNPVERNKLALAVAESTGKLSRPILRSFSFPQRVALNLAALRGRQAVTRKLEHYQAQLQRKEQGKPVMDRPREKKPPGFFFRPRPAFRTA